MIYPLFIWFSGAAQSPVVNQALPVNGSVKDGGKSVDLLNMNASIVNKALPRLVPARVMIAQVGGGGDLEVLPRPTVQTQSNYDGLV